MQFSAKSFTAIVESGTPAAKDFSAVKILYIITQIDYI